MSEGAVGESSGEHCNKCDEDQCEQQQPGPISAELTVYLLVISFLLHSCLRCC